MNDFDSTQHLHLRLTNPMPVKSLDSGPNWLLSIELDLEAGKDPIILKICISIFFYEN
jgi:hypothetical protein